MALKTTPVSRPNWNSRHVRWKSLIKVGRNGTFVKTFQSIKGHNLDWNTLARLLWKSFRRHPRFPHERAWNSVNIWLQTTATTDRQTEICSKLHLPPLCQEAKSIRRAVKQPWNTYLHWCIFLLQANCELSIRSADGAWGYKTISNVCVWHWSEVFPISKLISARRKQDMKRWWLN